MFRAYQNLQVTIGPLTSAGYPISVHGPGGDANDILVLPTDDQAYMELTKRVERLDVDSDTLSQLGQILFRTMFHGHLKEVYTRCQGMLAADQGLRLIVAIDEHAPEIAALRWEFLHDPDRGPLALLDVSVVRYQRQQTRIPTLYTPLPVTVLLTAAQQPMNVDVMRELGEVQEALAGLKNVIDIVVEPHLTFAKLQRILRQGVHVWHFVGYGNNANAPATGQLIFERDDGSAAVVSASELGILLNRSGVRLVIVHYGTDAGMVSTPLSDIALVLLRAEIPAMVEIRATPSESVTQAFAGEFYRALAEGLPVDACVTEGRKAVMNTGGLENPYWGIPIVYTRALDGRLFELPAKASTAPLLHRGSNVFNHMDIASIATHLYEWKIVHSNVQDVFINTPRMKRELFLAERRITYETIGRLQDAWFEFFDKRLIRLRQHLDGLKVVGDFFEIVELKNMLFQLEHIQNHIRMLRAGDRETFVVLKQMLFRMSELLEETLRLADIYIIEIAEELKKRG